MRIRGSLYLSFAIVAVLLVAVAGPARAQEPVPQTYGILSTIYDWIPITEFNPDNTGFGLVYDGGGFYHAEGTNANPFFMATVRLPNGAIWDGVTIFYYDNDASHDLEFLVERYYGVNSSQQVTQIFSSGQPGYASAYLPVGLTIDHANNFYVVGVNIDLSPTLQFRAARIEYHLQVSPAPGTATFSDVPTNYWAFQYIEALAASGITAGCGGGNFCPGAPVTRDQMAVFLAKALGLHFPD